MFVVLVVQKATSKMNSGKIYAVTGAGSGIGRATTIKLAEQGALVIGISDTDLSGLEETKTLCMGLPKYLPAQT